MVSVSAADPLNLVGDLLRGDRVPALIRNRVLYRDGGPIAVLESGEIRCLIDIEGGMEWQVRQMLVRRKEVQRLRAWVGR